MAMELEDLVADLAPRVLRYSRGRTHCPHLAEEVAQDALSALVQRWRRRGPPENPTAFVFAIARRRSARALLRRRLMVPLEALLDRPSPAPDPAEKTQRRAAVDEALAALGRLAARDREVLLLVAGGELDLGSIGEILGISGSAVKMRVHRARKRLAKLSEENNEAS